MMYVDKDGRFFFIPIIIGAIIGATSGAMIGHANGATGWDMFGYIAGGAVLGGLSGGAAAGVSAIGGGAMAAGAAAGAVGGAGFSGLATGWDGDAMLQGAAFGAISGFVGGGFAAAIGGGGGAFVGGAAGAGLNTAMNGGNLEQIGISMLAGGALAYGAYELTSYIAYRQANLEINNHKVSYNQFKTMQADYQRSRFWHKEYGGILTKNGGVVRAPAAYREKYGVNFDPAWTGQVSADDMVTHYHIHWDANNRFIGFTPSGQEVRTANGPSPYDLSFVRNTSSLIPTGMLIDRQSLYYYNMLSIDNNWGANITQFIGDNFLRYFPLYWWGQK